MNMSENWLVYTSPITAEEKAAAEARKQTAIESANALVMEHINSIAITIEFEDGEEAGTLADLQRAIDVARTDELERFVESHCIPYDGGYLSIKF